MEKKGQAAMEFLMTYGWAILVVLVAIGALAYFGVLSPSKFLPVSCTIEPGIGCSGDFKVTASSVQLMLTNGKGESMTGVTVGATGCATSGSMTWADGTVLSAGNSTGVTLTGCSNGAVGDRVKKTITIAYTSAGGIAHTVTGDLTGKVEA